MELGFKFSPDWFLLFCCYNHFFCPCSEKPWPAGVSNLLASLDQTGRRRVVLHHTLNTVQHEITTKSHNVLIKSVIVCWATFIAILSPIWPEGHREGIIRSTLQRSLSPCQLSLCGWCMLSFKASSSQESIKDFLFWNLSKSLFIQSQISDLLSLITLSESLSLWKCAACLTGSQLLTSHHWRACTKINYKKKFLQSSNGPDG